MSPVYTMHFDNPEGYLFKYVLFEHIEEYVGQGWEIVGVMQNTKTSINSVRSFVVALRL